MDIAKRLVTHSNIAAKRPLMMNQKERNGEQMKEKGHPQQQLQQTEET